MATRTMTKLVTIALSGYLFGQTLVWSHLVLLPQRITTADHNTDSINTNTVTGILVIYISALVTSTCIISVANKTGIVNISPRKPSNYGWFKYDGNVVGGLLQGSSMFVLRSEPSITLVELGMGVSRARWAVLGGVVGGLVFVLINEKLKNRAAAAEIQNESTLSSGEGTIAVWILSVVAAVFSVVVLWSWSSWTMGFKASASHAVYGGCGIGLSQLASLVLTKGTLGVSSVYPSLATHAVRVLDKSRPNPGYSSLVFACGVIVSGVIAGFNKTDNAASLDQQQSNVTTFVAGALLIFGARVAGGCTSGHGLSGCGLLSISSYITVLAMVAGIVGCRYIS